MNDKTTDAYENITVDITNANQRFDRFLRKFYKPYTTITLPTIYSWIRKGYIRINGKKKNEDSKVLL
jgi:23S rRNA-/tRNA-specific pseudouridylate synthase